MIVRSQNGWPAFHTPEEGHFVRFTAAGRGFWAANADVAVVAGEFLRRFNAEVEPLILPGEVLNDWSFADRLVRGSTESVSNHGSATAWDVNSDRHPLGKVGTFGPGKLAAMRRIKNQITDDTGRPVLRLGADYTGRKDEMHVEINASPAEVKQAADKIRAQQEAPQMQLSDKITLSSTAARAYSQPGYTRRKEGDQLSLNFMIQWGGPGLYRLLGKVDALAAQNAALAIQLTTLTTAVKAIASGSPDAVRAAFSAGVDELKAELAQIDVRVTLAQDDTEGDDHG